jgi:hypothetical protein
MQKEEKKEKMMMMKRIIGMVDNKMFNVHNNEYL